MFLLPGNAVNRSAPLNRGLTAWWLHLPNRLGCGGVTFRDLTGSYHGTLTNSPTWNGLRNPGGFGSLLFNDSNNYVTTSASSVSTTYSFSAWCCLNANGNYPMVVTGTGNNCDLRFEANTRVPQFRGTAGSSVIALNTWVHLCVSVSSATATLYVNGKSEATGSAGSPSLSSLQIGRRSDGFYFPGWINDVRFYSSRALSASEVSALYRASMAGYQNELNWQRYPVIESPQAAVTSVVPYYHLFGGVT